MKRHIFLFVILSVLMATTVLAQSNAYGPDPSYNWRGLYFGVQGSYHTGNSNWDEPFGGFRISHDIEGGMGGFYVGYNFQTPYHFVFGIETEMSFGSVDGSSSCPNASFSCHTDVKWIGSTRGRFGYAFDRFMPFVSIGWAYGTADTYVKHLPTGSESGSDNSYFGFVPGIGFEVAVTRNLLIRAEYNFYYFYETDVDIDYARTTVQFDTSAFKIGLSFKF